MRIHFGNSRAMLLSSSETKGEYLISLVPQPLIDNSSSYRTQITKYEHLPTLSRENGCRSSFPIRVQLGMQNGVQDAEKKYSYQNPE